MSRQRFFVYAASALLFGSIGIYFGSRKLPAESPMAAAASQLFALSLPDATGKPHALSQWKGKSLVVNFWATWCGPCVQEMPELSALQTESKFKNMQIIGIGIDSERNIAEFSSKYSITYPLYVSGMAGAELARRFGNLSGGLPFTVLIGPEGQVKKTYLGRLKLAELRRDILDL
ncbi:MAG TPA: alkyl hydroperoxide reductase [Oxalobacteraceae bacterium]|jgi:thiol-disulfide isomerase/thioredoxin|nr:alkyl hydroperoxide reductase [Oxalobacteraceae bacterium]